MTVDVAALRAREFPWMAGSGEIYLNAASTGPLPERTMRVLDEWTRLRATPHRITEEQLFGTVARARELVAAMIHARPPEIAIAVNTGFGVNLAARALPLAPGDVIVTPDLEFPANVYPWMAAARERGLEYRLIPCADGLVDEEALLAALDDRAVKVLAVSWVGFATGARVDLARLGHACRERGVYFVVDAIQGLGACPLDVRATPVDVLACGAQKWLLSPWGSGFVYVREALVERLAPTMVGWTATRVTDDLERLLEYDLTWRGDARRFETVTLPYQDIAGMTASLELLAELGHEAVAAHAASLADEIVRWAADRDDVALVTPPAPGRRAAIVALRPRDAQRASTRLQDAGIVHALREGAIRLAPYVYNTIDEVRAALGIFARG